MTDSKTDVPILELRNLSKNFGGLKATRDVSFRVMITLALGEILWGLAYRWISLTGGDNGLSLKTRPEPFGFSLANANTFYFATLVVFLLSLTAMAIFVRSPLGAALMGTRDQPRRMNALGYHVWAIRFYACMVLVAFVVSVFLEYKGYRYDGYRAAHGYTMDAPFNKEREFL